MTLGILLCDKYLCLITILWTDNYNSIPGSTHTKIGIINLLIEQIIKKTPVTQLVRVRPL